VLWPERLGHHGFRLLDAVVVRERRLLKGMIVTLDRVHSGLRVGSSVAHDIRSASSWQTVANVCRRRMWRLATPKTLGVFGVAKVEKGHGWLFPQTARAAAAMTGFC
jgi:hypothetical protein